MSYPPPRPFLLATNKRRASRIRYMGWLGLVAVLSSGCAESRVNVGTESSRFGGSGPTSGAGGTVTIHLDASFLATGDDAAIVKTIVSCDSGDDGCSCPPFNVVVIGKPGKWGANPFGDPDTALQEWLNSSSAGTAKVDNFIQRTTLTPDFLNRYNLLIIASLSDDSNLGPWWTFTDDEVAAFKTWIENGGAVISMIGYSGNPDEIRPVNQLIGFSGVLYTTEGIWGPKSNDGNIYYCNQSNPLTDWKRSDPVVANLSNGVTMVGFTNGRAITCPADGRVAATSDGKDVLVGKIVKEGRVLAYGDEWISYTTQWKGEGNPMALDPSCNGYLAKDKFQMSQFWYNMIRWAQPRATCFTIVDTLVPVVIW